MMYEENTNTGFDLAEKIGHMIEAFVILVGFHAIITLLSILMNAIKKQGMEYLSLLNWIKVGVILWQANDKDEQEDSQVQFANKVALKIFKKSFANKDKELTDPEFNQKIFDRIDFAS